MRNLLILRGAPGCGKSTWIKQNNLEPFVLSSDDIRLQVAGMELNAQGKFVISQNSNKKVFEALYKILEEKMKIGEFVIVDATHSRVKELNVYNKLCKEYRYRKYYVQFDTDLQTCKERNRQRESFRIVPDKAVEKVFNRIALNPMSESWKRIDQNKVKEELLSYKASDFNEYKSVEIFGDIHGCYEPLKKHFEENPFNNETMYIFVGDYLDRGIQNREVLESLMNLSENDNVIFLEGNHEKWLKLYSEDKIEEIRSHEFVQRTIKQLEGTNKKDIRQFNRKLGQICFFEFDNKKYLVCHGGISKAVENLIQIPTKQFINGVGDYSTEIDQIYADNDTSGIIQVHGHRNVSQDNDGTDLSINLEGKVEFGGSLKVLKLEKGQESKILKYKNDVYRKISAGDFKESELIREKDLGNGISSFNFTKDAFFDKKWDDLTCKARGLFMDVANNKVVARGYEKFFNIGEVKETKMENLREHLTSDITCYKKENGFLGILSYVNGDLMFCSKSSNDSEYSGYFKELFYSSKCIFHDLVIDYLKENDYSLVFEVVDIKNDPHIIEHKESDLILLDAIKNQMEFERLPYDDLVTLAHRFNVSYKRIYQWFPNFDDFKLWYDHLHTENYNDIEGVVIESGNFMCKLKFDYYLFWKHMRSIVETLNKYGSYNKKLEDPKAIEFANWIKEHQELWDKDIIQIRKQYLKETK